MKGQGCKCCSPYHFPTIRLPSPPLPEEDQGGNAKRRNRQNRIDPPLLPPRRLRRTSCGRFSACCRRLRGNLIVSHGLRVPIHLRQPVTVCSRWFRSHQDEAVTIPLHGTRARFQPPHRCRCDECRSANAEYQRAYRRARTPRPIKVCSGSTDASRYMTSWDCVTKAEYDAMRAETTPARSSGYSVLSMLD